MTRADVFFHQDGRFYYVSFGGDVPGYVEDDIERIEGMLGEEYERRVPDGGKIHVGEIHYGDGKWTLKPKPLSSVGPARYESYDDAWTEPVNDDFGDFGGF